MKPAVRWMARHPEACVFATCAIVFFVLVLFGL